MPVPATTGQLRTNLKEMKIGDYIPCYYIKRNYAYCFGLGYIEEEASEVPLTGISVNNVAGNFYFIKVDRGLLIADRVISSNVTWGLLNSFGLIEGRNYFWDKEYNGYTMPDTVGWAKYGTASTGASVLPDGRLSYNKAANVSLMYVVAQNQAPYRSHITMEVKFQWVSGLFGIAEIADGTKRVVVTILDNNLRVGKTGNVAVNIATVEPNEVYTVRVDKYGTDRWEIYLNGELISTGSYNDLPDFTERYVGFGTRNTTYSSTGYYHYVKYSEIDKGTVEEGIIRAPTGGVAYADENGNLTYVQPNPSRGGFPLNNEWDRYVMNFPPRLIQGGMSADDVFHYSVVGTIVQDTTAGTQWRNMGGVTSTINSSYRVYRGYTGRTDNDWRDVSFFKPDDALNWVGFRPVFQYYE